MSCIYCNGSSAIGSSCWRCAPKLPWNAYRCPVCEGRGLVPAGFYDVGETRINIAPSDPCRSCENGVIWSTR